jgi:hypothetical protein
MAIIFIIFVWAWAVIAVLSYPLEHAIEWMDAGK